MRGFRAPILVCACLLLMLPAHAAALTARARVSAHAPIIDGDVAAAQSEALEAALVKAVENVLGQIIPEKTYAALEALLREKITPQAEHFITNYQIVSQDVSDRSYTVHLSVAVDTDLLRKNLARIGVIREPGSPPLTAVFVTVDAPMGLDHVKSLGRIAVENVSTELERAGLTVIPVNGEDPGFRIIRPPQAPEALVSEGLVTMADLSVGILFQKRGEAQVTGSAMQIPMYLSLQAVEVQSGTLVDVSLQEVVVSMDTRDGTLLSRDLGREMTEIGSRVSSTLRERFLSGEAAGDSLALTFEGKPDFRKVRSVIGEIQFRMGEGTTIIPVNFSPDRSVYSIWSTREPDEVVKTLSQSEFVTESFTLLRHEAGVTLVPKAQKQAQGVLEFGEEVVFYRRLPVPGIENPDDVRKIEYVAWQEMEENGEFARANAAPAGMGILGRVDPSRDQDFFRFTLPGGSREIAVYLEQTGPGEVRPRLRVFSTAGRLLYEHIARSRGRNLYFTLTVHEQVREVVLSVEDYLGRYPS
ncbi:MAG: hypothetical protein JSV00_08210, partial [bacterium]